MWIWWVFLIDFCVYARDVDCTIFFYDLMRGFNNEWFKIVMRAFSHLNKMTTKFSFNFLFNVFFMSRIRHIIKSIIGEIFSVLKVWRTNKISEFFFLRFEWFFMSFLDVDNIMVLSTILGELCLLVAFRKCVKIL